MNTLKRLKELETKLNNEYEQARKEIARIVRDELPKVKTKVSKKRCGAGYLIVKVSKKDKELSKKLSMRIADLMKIIDETILKDEGSLK